MGGSQPLNLATELLPKRTSFAAGGVFVAGVVVVLMGVMMESDAIFGTKSSSSSSGRLSIEETETGEEGC